MTRKTKILRSNYISSTWKKGDQRYWEVIIFPQHEKRRCISDVFNSPWCYTKNYKKQCAS